MFACRGFGGAAAKTSQGALISQMPRSPEEPASARDAMATTSRATESPTSGLS